MWSFNSRTRVGATSPVKTASLLVASFNSRTRVGATVRVHVFKIQILVSIHAPVWVRQRSLLTACLYIQFQFTHPCGCDLPLSSMGNDWTSFNSRTRVGATGDFPPRRHQSDRFNSRTRVGATPTCEPKAEPYVSFNSRTRVGATVRK